MPTPSQLSIKTSSVIRLAKEKASYHKELVSQEEKIKKMEANNEDIYDINKQKEVLEDTKKTIPYTSSKLRDAVEALQIELESAQDGEERKKAEDAVETGKAALRDDNTLF